MTFAAPTPNTGGIENAVDISLLPPPDLVVNPNFAERLGEMIRQFAGELPITFDAVNHFPVIKKAELVVDPDGKEFFKIPKEEDRELEYLQRSSNWIINVLETDCYRECLASVATNKYWQSTLLAYAEKGDLDHLGQLFGVVRRMIDKGDPDAIPPVPATFESDSEYKNRIRLAPTRSSTAGSAKSYVFNALQGEPDIKSVAVEAVTFKYNPTTSKFEVDSDAGLQPPIQPGDIAIRLLSRVKSSTDNGTPTPEQIDKVSRYLHQDNVRPVCDNPRVISADVVEYDVIADVKIKPGGSDVEVKKQINKDLDKYCLETHKINTTVALSGLYDAIHNENVISVTIKSPTADQVAGIRKAYFAKKKEINIVQ